MSVHDLRVPDHAKREVAGLAGWQLTHLTVTLFDVSLTFTSDRTVWVQITKPFQFRLGEEPWRGCDPTALPGGGIIGDTEVVRLVGRTCAQGSLSEEELLLTFSEGGSLRVAHEASDFEPLHLIGDGPGAGDFFFDVW